MWGSVWMVRTHEGSSSVGVVMLYRSAQPLRDVARDDFLHTIHSVYALEQEITCKGEGLGGWRDRAGGKEI